MATRQRPGRGDRLIPTVLILYSAIPILAGSLRVAELSSGPEVTEANERFVGAPIPVLLHIVGACVFLILGAFQFRSNKNRRHRWAGRIVVPAGIIAALSGMWMTTFYELPSTDGTLLNIFRYIFGTAMAAFLIAGWVAVRQRRFQQHRAWMMRGYALGQATGTQAVLLLPPTIIVATPMGVTRALLMAAAWVINLAVAEWLIRRPSRRGQPTPTPRSGSPVYSSP